MTATLASAQAALVQIEARRKALTFKFGPGFLPEHARKRLIRGLKAALSGMPNRNRIFSVWMASDRTIRDEYMCNYLSGYFDMDFVEEHVDDAFATYSTSIWGVNISSRGQTAMGWLYRALGMTWSDILAQARRKLDAQGKPDVMPDGLASAMMRALVRLYYRQMLTDLIKEQRAYTKAKAFLTLYKQAFATYNQAILDRPYVQHFLCWHVNPGPEGKKRDWFSDRMEELMLSHGLRSSGGLMFRLCRQVQGRLMIQASEAQVHLPRARHWHMARIEELEGVLNGTYLPANS